MVCLSHCLRENVEEELRALAISVRRASVLPEFTECQGADAIGPGDVGCRVALAHS